MLERHARGRPFNTGDRSGGGSYRYLSVIAMAPTRPESQVAWRLALRDKWKGGEGNLTWWHSRSEDYGVGSSRVYVLLYLVSHEEGQHCVVEEDRYGGEDEKILLADAHQTAVGKGLPWRDNQQRGRPSITYVNLLSRDPQSRM